MVKGYIHREFMYLHDESVVLKDICKRNTPFPIFFLRIFKFCSVSPPPSPPLYFLLRLHFLSFFSAFSSTSPSSYSSFSLSSSSSSSSSSPSASSSSSAFVPLLSVPPSLALAADSSPLNFTLRNSCECILLSLNLSSLFCRAKNN